jgi:hypothetical protein
MLIVHVHVRVKPDRESTRYSAVFPADADDWASGPP